MTNIRASRRGTFLTTCPFTNSAFGSPTHPGFEVRLEKTQNLVSMKLPEVIESLRASCNEIGMAMTEIAMLAIRESSRQGQGLHVVWARPIIFGVCSVRDVGIDLEISWIR